MNRPLLITTGIVILLLMVGLWVYLLAYGAPEKPREVFTNLGFLSSPDTEVRVIDPYTEQNPGVQLALGSSQLQQLTTKAVAGFAFIAGEQKLRYIERGTGYGFEIDLVTGTEKQISLTTLPQTATAVFSPNAAAVVITTYEDYETVPVLGTFTEENALDLIELPTNAKNISFADDEKIYFTLESDAGTHGYVFNIPTLTRTQLFSVPLFNATMVWGNGVGSMYISPAFTSKLEGGAYEIVSGTLVPVGDSGYGLTAVGFNDGVMTSAQKGNEYTATAHLSDTAYKQGMAMLPEKCAPLPHAEALFICGSPLEVISPEVVEQWYKGDFISVDYLWFTDLSAQTSNLLANLTELSGRTIDVDGITADASGTLLLFRNKIDGALWLYKVAP